MTIMSRVPLAKPTVRNPPKKSQPVWCGRRIEDLVVTRPIIDCDEKMMDLFVIYSSLIFYVVYFALFF